MKNKFNIGDRVFLRSDISKKEMLGYDVGTCMKSLFGTEVTITRYDHISAIPVYYIKELPGWYFFEPLFVDPLENIEFNEDEYSALMNF